MAALIAAHGVALPGASAQGISASASSGRAELEAAREQLTQRASETTDPNKRTRLLGEAELIETRLREGDFEPGDRIVVTVEGDTALSDTFTVRDARVLELDQLPELSLAGVLRAEAQDRIARHVATYLRDPVVRVTPLVRIGIIGAVQRQGFYSIPADVPIGDAIMLAGGLSEQSDIRKTEVRRESVDILNREEVQQALRTGATLDQLNLRAGDQIVVGEKSPLNWENGLRLAAILAGLAYAFR